MQLQHLDSKVPRLYFNQEALLLQRTSLKWPGEVSKGSQFLQVQLFAFPHHRVSWRQMERASHGRLWHSRHHSSHQLQHV